MVLHFPFNVCAAPVSLRCPGLIHILFYELYYLLEGERVYFINGKVHVAQQGDMVIIVPHDLHSTASSQVEQFERKLSISLRSFFMKRAEKSFKCLHFSSLF